MTARPVTPVTSTTPPLPLKAQSPKVVRRTPRTSIGIQKILGPNAMGSWTSARALRPSSGIPSKSRCLENRMNTAISMPSHAANTTTWRVLTIE